MIEVIIATNNRSENAFSLAKSLIFLQKAIIDKISIIDSTNNQKLIKPKEKKIKHILSSKQNQPYQRYLGFLNSESDILLYLDDDMEIANKNFIEIILGYFKKNDIAALAINFRNKHENTSLNNIPKSKFNIDSNLKNLFNWFTGYPNMSPGSFGLCGNRGAQPKNGGFTNYLNGGAFAVRRSHMYHNFNFSLFDLYHKQLGKGEDAITGYTISKSGKIIFCNELLFYHNDKLDSVYTKDLFNYSKRVAYSRKYLSLEKCRLDGKSSLFAKVHFQWYCLWRILGLFFNFVIDVNDERKKLLTGTISGWFNSNKYHFKFKEKLNQ
mgnify:CR=1 FL=1